MIQAKRIVLSQLEKHESLQIKAGQAERQFARLQVGNQIECTELLQGGGNIPNRERQKSGIIITKYPDKFVMENDNGRKEMIMLVDVISGHIKLKEV